CTFLVDRQFLARHAPKHLGGGADMNDRLWSVLLQGIQHPHRALDVGVQSVDWRIEARTWKALRGEVEDIVGFGLGHGIANGQAVPKIDVEKIDPLLRVDPPDQMRKVVHRAAPATQSEDFPVRLLDEVVGEVRTHHSGDASDEYARPSHPMSNFLEGPT